MAINIRETQQGIVRTINDLVGKNACGSRQMFTSPCVLARQNGTRPDLPFVMIDRMPLSKYGYNGVISNFFDETDNLNTITNYKATFMINVIGAEADDVISKAQEIRDTFFREYGRLKLETETNGALLDVSEPSFNFQYFNTEYQETSTLILELTVSDQFIEDDPMCPSTSDIRRINTTGELNKIPDDPTPLTTESQTTIIPVYNYNGVNNFADGTMVSQIFHRYSRQMVIKTSMSYPLPVT